MLLKQKYSHPQKCKQKYNNPQRCKRWQKHNEGQWKLRHESEIITKRRCMILDRVTFLEKGIKTSNPKRLVWTQVKQNYDRHVERMENWNDIDEEED